MSSLPPSKPIIAAFDFDGTITTKDSLLPFLIYTHGYFKTFYQLIKLIPAFFAYAMSGRSVSPATRQQTKEKVLTRFFAGTSLSELQEKGKDFASSRQLKAIIRPEAEKRISWHRAQNHRCILISASIEVYLAPWSKLHGFDDLICSTLEVTPSNKVTGNLQGLNCWGPEKTRRLQLLIGEKKSHTLYAYGDSLGDKELLELADYPFYRRME